MIPDTGGGGVVEIDFIHKTLKLVKEPKIRGIKVNFSLISTKLQLYLVYFWFMKKILLGFLLVLFLGCDDGDLQIETLDFDNANIQVCDNRPVTANATNVLFKLNDIETLILELPATAIKNEITLPPITIGVSATGPGKITYRTFSAKVGKDYFCSEIPLTEPNVISEIVATGGSVLIETTMSTDSTKFEHAIVLSEISLKTSDDVRITDLRINNFGTVITAVPE